MITLVVMSDDGNGNDGNSNNSNDRKKLVIVTIAKTLGTVVAVATVIFQEHRDIPF